MSYCNIFRKKIKIFFKRRSSNKARYSANKVYISKPELNNTNTKLSVILYTYNKKKLSIELHLKKLITLSRVYRLLIEKNSELLISRNNFFYTLKKRTYYKKIKDMNYIESHRNKILLLLKENYLFLNE